MTWYTDDRALYWEQRKLDAEQEAARQKLAIIILKEDQDGDYTVVRGGDIYRTWEGQPRPDSVKAGDRASASEVCDWISHGAKVEVSEPNKPAYRSVI